VVLDDEHHVDYTDTSITLNTRGAYPIEFIANAKIPCIAGHPTDVIFLTCDAFGVLPPVSALSPAHAMYHFISGYTAKVAGTENRRHQPRWSASQRAQALRLISAMSSGATSPRSISSSPIWTSRRSCSRRSSHTSFDSLNQVTNSLRSSAGSVAAAALIS
jgi:hypothetical protein